MFPDIDPALIENSGEQRFYEAAATLPDAYSVFYRDKVEAQRTNFALYAFYEEDYILGGGKEER